MYLMTLCFLALIFAPCMHAGSWYDFFSSFSPLAWYAKYQENQRDKEALVNYLQPYVWATQVNNVLFGVNLSFEKAMTIAKQDWKINYRLEKLKLSDAEVGRLWQRSRLKLDETNKTEVHNEYNKLLNSFSDQASKKLTCRYEVGNADNSNRSQWESISEAYYSRRKKMSRPKIFSCTAQTDLKDSSNIDQILREQYVDFLSKKTNGVEDAFVGDICEKIKQNNENKEFFENVRHLVFAIDSFEKTHKRYENVDIRSFDPTQKAINKKVHRADVDLCDSALPFLGDDGQDKKKVLRFLQKIDNNKNIKDNFFDIMAHKKPSELSTLKVERVEMPDQSIRYYYSSYDPKPDEQSCVKSV